MPWSGTQYQYALVPRYGDVGGSIDEGWGQFTKIVKYPVGMSLQGAENSGLLEPIEDPGLALELLQSGKVQGTEDLDPSYLEDPALLSQLTGIPFGAAGDGTVSTLDPVTGEIVRTPAGEEEELATEEEELSPADDLAQRILDGEIGPNSYFNAATGEWTQGSPLSPLTGGSLTSAPSIAGVTSTPDVYYQNQPTAVGQTGYVPIVGDSLLKGSQYSLSPQQAPVDLNNDGIISDQEAAVGFNPFDPNTPDRNLAEELAEVNRYGHLRFDANDPASWLTSDEERMIPILNEGYYDRYKDWFGQGVDALPEGFERPADVLLEPGRYIPVNHPSYYDYHRALRSGNQQGAQWILDLFGVDGDVLKSVEPNDPIFQTREDTTPWADFSTGELPQIKNPPPWHPAHNPRLDIMGRPITSGGLGWGTWLQMNSMDPETGIPVNPNWDNEYQVPLTSGLLGPEAGSNFETFVNSFDPAATEEQHVYRTPAPPVDTAQTQQKTSAVYSDQASYEDDFGSVTALGNAIEEGALPPLEMGAGKGTPLQQVMPGQSSYVDPYAQAPVETPLRSAVAAPADGTISSPANRGLFPRRM